MSAQLVDLLIRKIALDSAIDHFHRAAGKVLGKRRFELARERVALSDTDAKSDRVPEAEYPKPLLGKLAPDLRSSKTIRIDYNRLCKGVAGLIGDHFEAQSGDGPMFDLRRSKTGKTWLQQSHAEFGKQQRQKKTDCQHQQFSAQRVPRLLPRSNIWLWSHVDDDAPVSRFGT